MTAKEKIARHLGEVRNDRLAPAFLERWGVEIETDFDLLGSMRYVTTRVDGEVFPLEQHEWIAAFMTGWDACKAEVER